jgi:hypothetical protein
MILGVLFDLTALRQRVQPPERARFAAAGEKRQCDTLAPGLRCISSSSRNSRIRVRSGRCGLRNGFGFEGGFCFEGGLQTSGQSSAGAEAITAGGRPPGASQRRTSSRTGGGHRDSSSNAACSKTQCSLLKSNDSYFETTR